MSFVPSVFVVGNDHLIKNMFRKRGWEITRSDAEADLIQFTGGEDVSPSLYGQGQHVQTVCNPTRDQYESNIFHNNQDKYLAGICRGGQFLNVMCGGSMWQHVDGHARRDTHPLTMVDGKTVEVTSTHHQMMVPGEFGDVLGTASESSFKENDERREEAKKGGKFEDDVEIVFYGGNKALCFQPHPEYVNENHECQELYFSLLEEMFSLGV